MHTAAGLCRHLQVTWSSNKRPAGQPWVVRAENPTRRAFLTNDSRAGGCLPMSAVLYPCPLARAANVVSLSGNPQDTPRVFTTRWLVLETMPEAGAGGNRVRRQQRHTHSRCASPKAWGAETLARGQAILQRRGHHWVSGRHPGTRARWLSQGPEPGNTFSKGPGVEEPPRRRQVLLQSNGTGGTMPPKLTLTPPAAEEAEEYNEMQVAGRFTPRKTGKTERTSWGPSWVYDPSTR